MRSHFIDEPELEFGSGGRHGEILAHRSWCAWA